MGNILYTLYNKKDDKLTFYIPLKPNCKIRINQAYCHTCNNTVISGNHCKCGNVEVFGDNVSLGRKVKNLEAYSNINMLEYS
jgi:hypothetical protein